MEGLIGKKQGMTQVFGENGQSIPVTVIEVGPCVVIQRKTREKDGYDAVQVGFASQKNHRCSRAALGRFQKAGATPLKHLHEFSVEEGDPLKEGESVTAAIFEGLTYVSVTGVSKGKGFQGVVRRHSMAGGPLTHGGHSKRRIGAIGQRSYPGRVAKDHHMPGHMGHVQVTQQNLRVVQVRKEDNLLLVRGAVPGPTGGIVIVKKALRQAAMEKAG